MSVTAKLFLFGDSQAVLIPVHLRFESAQEVEVVLRGDERKCAALGVKLTAVPA